MRTVAYNLIVAFAVVAVLCGVRQRRTVPMAWSIAAALAALLLATVADTNTFDVMRLASFAVFVHAPIAAAGVAVLLRRDRPATATVAAVLALSVVAIGIDAFLIEPRSLEVTHVALSSAKLDAPLRIAVVSDIQMDDFTDYERRALSDAMAQHPDIVLFSGDYIQAASPADAARIRESFREYLRKIDFHAPLGVYAVQGNVEDESRWPDIFSGLPVTVFPASATVTRDGVAVTGLTLGDSFNRAITIPADARFHIVLGHGPDFSLGAVDADLLVAGHTHGGQVRLPFIGSLITLSAVPRSRAAGVTDLGGGRTLVVSRGVGMERGPAPRLRFLCRPELVVVDVRPEPRR